MSRRSKSKKKPKKKRSKRPGQQRPPRPDPVPPGVPPNLRQALETVRLDILALLRTLDRLRIAQSQPPELHALYELDADFAEALWALDQPPGSLNFAAMTRDTLASLEALPVLRQDFFAVLSDEEQDEIAERFPEIRAAIHPAEAYNCVLGRDPAAG